MSVGDGVSAVDSADGFVVGDGDRDDDVGVVGGTAERVGDGC